MADFAQFAHERANVPWAPPGSISSGVQQHVMAEIAKGVEAGDEERVAQVFAHHLHTVRSFMMQPEVRATLKGTVWRELKRIHVHAAGITTDAVVEDAVTASLIGAGLAVVGIGAWQVAAVTAGAYVAVELAKRIGVSSESASWLVKHGFADLHHNYRSWSAERRSKSMEAMLAHLASPEEIDEERRGRLFAGLAHGGGGSIAARGGQAAKEVEAGWQSEQPVKNADDLAVRGQKHQRELSAMAATIAKAVNNGTVIRDPGAKTRESIDRKIAAGKSPQQITDAVRLGFEVKAGPAIADQIIKHLADDDHLQVADEGWRQTEAGYFDRTAKVRFPDGTVGETQVFSPGMWPVKLQGHALIKRGRCR